MEKQPFLFDIALDHKKTFMYLWDKFHQCYFPAVKYNLCCGGLEIVKEKYEDT